ncbi:MAG: OmpA family protein [Polyangiaceae bacterium]|nr:OmpA family protein [Polyangiaceae bacterium]
MRDAKVIIITKKAKGHAAHHGGAWKVAYADFVTAMMALFIVLWLISQTDQSTRQKLSEYFRTGMFSGAPSVVMGGSGVNKKGFLDGRSGTLELQRTTLARSAQRVKQALLVAAEKSPELKRLQQHVEVHTTEQGLLIQIIDNRDDVLFDLSSAALKPDLRKLLETIGPILGNLDNALQVHGHTDARPFPRGSTRTNWELSFERADNARRVLEQCGVRKGQIAGVFAHADTALRVPDNPLADENRRLAILAVAWGSEHPALHGVEPKTNPLQPTTRTSTTASRAKRSESTL